MKLKELADKVRTSQELTPEERAMVALTLSSHEATEAAIGIAKGSGAILTLSALPEGEDLPTFAVIVVDSPEREDWERIKAVLGSD